MKTYHAYRKDQIFRFASFLNRRLDSLFSSISNRFPNCPPFISPICFRAKVAVIFFQTILVIIAFSASVHAATLVVNNVFDTFDGTCSNNFGCSLRDAIADASSGDTITFSDDFLGEVTIVLILGEVVIDKNLTIDGYIVDEIDEYVRISGNDDSRVFSISPGIIVTLDGLEITHGYTTSPSYAGGIYIADGNIVTIRRCKFVDNNTEGQGGAIYNGNGLLISEKTTFTRNSAISHGGAIYNANGTVTVEKCRFDYNLSGYQGGAIYNNNGVLNVTERSRIVDNQARDAGGIFSNGILTVDQSVIVANIASGDTGGAINGFGGGIYCSNNSTIRNSYLAANIAGDGGGIYGSDQLTIENSTVSDNEATSTGGGIEIDATSSLIIRNTTIYGNRSDLGGSGLYIKWATHPDGEHLTNTIIAGSGGAEDCCLENGSLETNLHNLIEDGSCSPDFSGDPKIGDSVLSANTWILPLECDSPAIDAGDNALVPTGMTTDQREEGFPRILDGDSDGTAIVDLGAYELNRTTDCRKPSLGGVLHLLLGEND